MKKLFIALFILLVGCTLDYQEGKVSNPQASTTVALQNNVIDSCVVLSTDGRYIYVMEDGLATYRLSPINSNYEIVHVSYMLVTVLILIGIFIFLLVGLITKFSE